MGKPVREILEPYILEEDREELVNLPKSKLSNHLGFDLLLFTKDGYIILPLRSKDVTVNLGRYGPSVSGSFELSDIEGKDRIGAKELCKREAKEELEIGKNEFEARFCGLCRSLSWNGKPNLLFIGILDLEFNQLVERWEKSEDIESQSLVELNLGKLKIRNFEDLEKQSSKIKNSIGKFLQDDIGDPNEIHSGLAAIFYLIS